MTLIYGSERYPHPAATDGERACLAVARLDIVALPLLIGLDRIRGDSICTGTLVNG